MFGRKRIAELEQENCRLKVEGQKDYDGMRNMQSKLIRATLIRATHEINSLNEKIQYMEEIELANSLIPISEPITEVITEPLAWISGEPKDTGWYFVATGEWAEPGYYTTALFYNPAARCRWMRGEKGNAERFEREVIAYMEVPNYEK
jgi:hypothetical protein